MRSATINARRTGPARSAGGEGGQLRHAVVDRGAAVLHLIKRGIRPRDIMTREAFENAIAVVMALGGSTNAVLHLLAIAHEADVELSLADFERIGDDDDD